jgi:predicted enzyme related to lactoylglutathione lyase
MGCGCWLKRSAFTTYTRPVTPWRTNRIAHCGTLWTVIAFALLLLSCASPDSRLPPVTRRPTTEHHVGKVIWLDLATPDPESAKRFYGKLFGWTFYSDPHDAGYVMVYLRDHLIGGIIKPSVPVSAQHQSAWLTYLAVRDVDVAGRIALAHGAKELSAPRTYANRGRQAVFADPEGAVFALMASSTGDPPDVLLEPDRWIWSTVITHDVQIDSEFYQAILDYTIDVLPTDQGLEQVVLESGGYARATLNEIRHEASGLHSRWINFVRVEDALDTVAKAVAFGGRTLVSPHIDRHGGRIAVIADPQGAWFGVMEWPDGDHPKAAK